MKITTRNTLYAIIATVVSTVTSTQGFILPCPTECTCKMENYQSHVICAFQHLKEFPKELPSNLTHLDLHGNSISSLTNVFHNFTEVQILDLSFNDIAELKLEDFFFLSHLRQLNLEGNKISHLEENVFQPIQQLEILNLSNNSLISGTSAIFLGFNNLISLNLSHNMMTDLISQKSLFPETLKILDLSDNSIRTLTNSTVDNLDGLQVLNLRHNFIEVLDGSVFPEINNLTNLDLSKNCISKVVSNSSFSGILELDLSSNNISNATNLQLDHFSNLERLILDDNPLESISAPIFSKLFHLHYLSLSNMPKLIYLSKWTFVGLENLTELNLSYNLHMSFIHKELFTPIYSISIINLSYNNISTLFKEVFHSNTQLRDLYLTGNKLSCDCGISWILSEIDNKNSSLVDKELLDCVMPYTEETRPILQLEDDNLLCSDIKILNHSGDSKFKIGHPAMLKCEVEGSPKPEIMWITPRNRVFHFHNFHPYSSLDYLPLNTSITYYMYRHTHAPEEYPSYYSVSETDPNRILVMEDGSLYIDFVMRSDAGPYTCVARNPSNSSQVIINVFLDYNIVTTTYLWSLVVGSACAASFFVLNLTYSLTLAGIRRCISQRRRERIRQIIESMDQYKSHQLGRIKENYHHQVGRIRDQYHYQLGRLREHHQTQMGRMGRMREGASQKVEKLRENYNNQLGRLKDYSSNQLSQIRERYNNQIDKIKDYGNDKLDKIHEKYKLKQQHVIQLLEMMNFDNCRTVFESECVRTESMILQSDIFTSDIPIHSPIDSVSVSDSEYLTASSSESSKYNSQEKIDTEESSEQQNNSTSIHPYLPNEEKKPVDNSNNTLDENEGTCISAQVSSTKGESDDTKLHKNHGKRAFGIKHKRKKNLDSLGHLSYSNELETNEDETCNDLDRDCPVWQKFDNSEQLRPLLVKSHDDKSADHSAMEPSQGLLIDNGADTSHVVMDMPVVSVDNVRETVV